MRYLLVAGGAYWFFYSTSSGKSFIKHLKPVRWQSIRQDAELSVLSTVVFALCAAFIMSEYESGVTLLYTSVNQYGWWYLGVSFIAILILQDTYFYFIHRAFHSPWLFKWIHQGHHRSQKPTPWTSFAFDLPEALVQGLFFVGIVFFLPLHFITLIIALMTMTGWAVLTHLGFELFPSSLSCSWFIGSSHHLIHHRKYRMHYGLYFTFWDKLLGTEDPDFEKVQSSKIR